MRHLRILVLGYIWQPGIGLCGLEYNPPTPTGLNATEIANLAKDRQVTQDWLRENAGDFQGIEDFAVLSWEGEVLLDWAKPDSLDKYDAAYFGDEG